MKVEIDAAGVLTIMSETPLEAFALREWIEKYCHQDGLSTEKIIFRCSDGRSEEET